VAVATGTNMMVASLIQQFRRAFAHECKGQVLDDVSEPTSLLVPIISSGKVVLTA
jgi:hypothetical protein